MLNRYGLSRLIIFAVVAVARAQQTPVGEGPPSTTPTEPQSPSPRANPDTRTQRPLTPQEERERAIRRYDPKSNLDPINREQDSGLAPRAPSQREALQRPLPASRPLPGSIAASNQPDFLNSRSQGPQVLDPNQADSASQEYSGPAVLSRSYTLSRPTVPKEVGLTPSLGISEIYDTGVGALVTPGVNPVKQSTTGTSISWGLSGQHRWKRELISLNYQGNLNHYLGATGYNGTNQSLNIDYNRILSPHMIFSISQSASSNSQSRSLQSTALPQDSSVANINLALSPVAQPIDFGTKQLAYQAGLTWRKSARTSVRLGSGLFFVERTGVGGAGGGTTGEQVQADVSYRYSRKLTVGTYYSFTSYVFSKHASVSDSHTLGGIFSYAFNRSSQFRLRTGITQIESQSLAFVAFPADLAAILGQLGGIAVSYQKSALQDVSAEFVRDLGRQRLARLSYARGVAPGNGVLLTSKRESLTGGYNMRLFGKFSFGAGFGIDRLQAIDKGTSVPFSTRAYQANLSRAHSHGMSSNYALDIRSFTTLGSSVPQQQIRVSAGVSWSPGEGKLWK